MDALTTADAALLAEQEAIIEKELPGFVRAGTAFLIVRERRLWREGYESFEAYCRLRWKISRQQAYRLMAATEVVGNLSPMGDKRSRAVVPASERQARPLTALDPGQQRKAWGQALADEDTSAQHLGELARQMREEIEKEDREEREQQKTRVFSDEELLERIHSHIAGIKKHAPSLSDPRRVERVLAAVETLEELLKISAE